MLDRDIERRDEPPEGKALCLCHECGSDISEGDVTEGHTWEPWAACSDHLLRQRITDDCIMF